MSGDLDLESNSGVSLDELEMPVSVASLKLSDGSWCNDDLDCMFLEETDAEVGGTLAECRSGV